MSVDLFGSRFVSSGHVGLKVAPEAEVGPEGFVADVTDEGFDVAEQLLVSLQIFARAKKISAFLTRPHTRFLRTNFSSLCVFQLTHGLL